MAGKTIIRALLCALLAGTAVAVKSADTPRLLTDIDREAKRLQGQGIAGKSKVPFQETERLGDLLSEALEKKQTAAVTGLVLRSAHDDAVYQAALRALVQHRKYSAQDLPDLCRVMLAKLPEADLAPPDRSRVDPATFRLRMADWIAELLGIAPLPPTEGPVSKRNAISDPRQWLRDAVRQAEKSGRNEATMKWREQCARQAR
jgi:hypothetical protein